MNPVNCSKCGLEVDQNGFCANCSPQRVTKLNGWLAIAIISFALIGYFVYGELSLTPEERELRAEAEISKRTHESIAKANEEISKIQSSCQNESEAYIWSQDFIKEKLKSPTTAKFPNSGDRGVSIRYLGNCTHNIIGYVDSQNGFGAIIRTKYHVIMQNKLNTNLWNATEINFLND